MVSRASLAAALGLLLACCGGDAEGSFSTNPGSDPLSKSVRVFDVMVRATAATPDAKILHTARVLAEYLDGDEDGVPDNPAVVHELVARGATLVMARDEAELRSIERKLPYTDAWQALWASEVVPGGRTQGRFDATLEEVLHLISHVGYANAYPAIFGEEPGSKLADAMDIARGGRFRTVPKRYPEGAWYTYDDVTCDYGCHVAEYLYWALTSLLGAQEYPGRLREIRHEWRLNTPERVREGDPRVYALLTDPQYGFATVLPDGAYAPIPFMVE